MNSEHIVGVDPHRDLQVFLEQQAELADLTRKIAPDAIAAVLYEPVLKTRPERITIGDGSRIDSFVKLEGGDGLLIGRYVHVASFAHLNIGGGQLRIDDFCAVASGAKIISGSNQIDALTMSACAPREIQRVKSDRTWMKKYSCILVNSVVLPGVTLGEGAVLAAGAVATKDIPEWEVWGGVPAKFMRKREVIL